MKLLTRLSMVGLLLAIGLAFGVYLTLDARAQGTADTLTGCLEKGKLSNLAVGDQPLKPCGDDASVVTWNQTGPRGPAGPGISDYEIVSAHEVVKPGVTVSAHCPEGKVVISGGSAVWDENFEAEINVPLSRSHPSPSGTAWKAASGFSLFPVGLAVYAVCVHVQ